MIGGTIIDGIREVEAKSASGQFERWGRDTKHRVSRDGFFNPENMNRLLGPSGVTHNCKWYQIRIRLTAERKLGELRTVPTH